jgi:hypothetical protein
MIELYVTLIIAGRRTISQVPTKLREAVMSELEVKGYDGELEGAL